MIKVLGTARKKFKKPSKICSCSKKQFVYSTLEARNMSRLVFSNSARIFSRFSQHFWVFFSLTFSRLLCLKKNLQNAFYSRSLCWQSACHPAFRFQVPILLACKNLLTGNTKRKPRNVFSFTLSIKLIKLPCSPCGTSSYSLEIIEDLSLAACRRFHVGVQNSIPTYFSEIVWLAESNEIQIYADSTSSSQKTSRKNLISPKC